MNLFENQPRMGAQSADKFSDFFHDGLTNEWTLSIAGGSIGDMIRSSNGAMI